jgi:hypothetical protein
MGRKERSVYHARYLLQGEPHDGCLGLRIPDTHVPTRAHDVISIEVSGALLPWPRKEVSRKHEQTAVGLELFGRCTPVQLKPRDGRGFWHHAVDDVHTTVGCIANNLIQGGKLAGWEGMTYVQPVLLRHAAVWLNKGLVLWRVLHPK